jgi:hypothetical protein
MARAAKAALESDSFHVVADAGYSNSEQAARCEAAGLLPHVPMTRAVNNQGAGSFFGREQFCYPQSSDTYLCPDGKTLRRRQTRRNDRLVVYTADPTDCGACAKKTHCTEARRRTVSRRLLLRGTAGAQTEISLAAMAYNIKRMVNILGGHKLLMQLRPA